MLNYCIERRKSRTTHANISQTNSLENNSNNHNKSSVSYQEYINKQGVGYNSSIHQESRDNSWNELLANIDKNEATESTQNILESSTDSDSDDEFFEARESVSEETTKESLEEVEEAATSSMKLPEGILKETSMKLLKTGVPLNIPITQVLIFILIFK